jgi:hypothetical protein
MSGARGIRSPTARSVAWCSASVWSAPDGSGLLTLGASSVQTDPEGSCRIVWMIKRMIKPCDAAPSVTQTTAGIVERSPDIPSSAPSTAGSETIPIGTCWLRCRSSLRMPAAASAGNPRRTSRHQSGMMTGARGRIRTDDLPITSQSLTFQLDPSADPVQANGIPCAFAAYLVQRDGGWERVERGPPWPRRTDPLGARGLTRSR